VVVDGAEKTLSLQLSNLTLATPASNTADVAADSLPLGNITAASQKKFKPNDACPCKSGKKYKKCCWK
jgi:uncharacterized protein YecA (UPF0149 family)